MMKKDILGTKQFYVLLSALLLVVAGLLRFHDLSETSLWFDEARAANNSRGTFQQTIINTQHRNSSPVIYPIILHLVQKIDSSSTTVRLPSAVASVLAILVILSLPRAGIDKRVAFLAAALLTFSASQIEYAQEVREYSISVLFAAIMLYTMISYLRQNTNKPALYLTMFLAPLLQYGLVLFSVAVLSIMVLVERNRQNRRSSVSCYYLPAALLGIGGLLSIGLTLRYQWHRSTSAAYLEAFYYSGGYGNLRELVSFIAGNARRFLEYIMPGSHSVALGVPALGLIAYRCYRGKACHAPIPQLAVIAISVVILASIAHIYPFGPIRQDLFLAPVISLVFSIAYVSVADGLGRTEHNIWMSMVFLLILASGLADIRSGNPYREREDIKRVLAGLNDNLSPADQVYIHRTARHALEFYNISGKNYVYGDARYTMPDDFLTEFNALIDQQTRRVWLVFSHTRGDKEQPLIEKLGDEWEVDNRVHAVGANLYLALRHNGASHHTTDTRRQIP